MSHAEAAVEPQEEEQHDPIRSNFVFDKEFQVNTSDEIILGNVERNIRRQLPQLGHHEEQQKEVAIVAGGWSLNETLDELVELWWAGTPIIALNGAGNWLVERNIRPAVIAVLDARPMNVVFVEKAVPNCKYVLASQCDPSLFDACEGRETYIYHTVGDREDETEVLEKYYHGNQSCVPGGSTIGLRAVPMAHMMGFRKMHIFGMDSCVKGDAHHGYKQEWDDGQEVRPFVCGGRKFMCSAWQISQAKEFTRFVASQGQHFALSMHGDGLLSHIIKTGAELEGED